MGVHIDFDPVCTNSHLDFFIRNIVVCKGDARLAHVNGATAVVRLPDASEAPEEPLSLHDVKDHISIRHNELDHQIAGWIVAARRKVETDTGIALVPGAYRITVTRFPMYGQPLLLPLWPVTSVESAAYYTRDGVETSIAETLTVSDGRPTLVHLPQSAQWPTDVRGFDPGVLEVKAGFASPNLVPEDLKHAMKVLIDHMSTFRGHVSTTAIENIGIDYDRWIERWQLPTL
jgi:uncharacterized phiE125 gp8 family phage protein